MTGPDTAPRSWGRRQTSTAAQRLRPSHWGIAARSAIVSGCVVLIAVGVIGAALVFFLYESLLSSVDDAAAGRVRDVVAALDFDAATDLDDSLLATDQRVFAVQVIDVQGNVIRRSANAPSTPLLPPDSFGPSMRTGIADDFSPNDDMRMAGRNARTATGVYTVIAGAGSEAAEHTAVVVATLLAVAGPIIAVVAAIASHRLVRRSLRSVEMIRARVAEISASDLAERVPVPPHHDEISALATTMNEMLARVEAGHTAQRRFVGDASHELRSPLASIISALEIANEYPEELDDELRNGTLIPEAHRMQTLVEDLLLLARADERELVIRHDDVELDSLIEGEATRLRRETDLDVQLDVESISLTGDPIGIGRVLRNLVDNAVQHAASAVDLSVERRGPFVALTVSDDGPGIAPADRSRIFDRFVRLDTARSRERGGTGLGLAIVSEIVAVHQGEVAIEDRVGGGTRVTVLLPVAPNDSKTVGGRRSGSTGRL